jgi:putative MATE family efflux protein
VNQIKDLTSGNIFPQIIKLAIPIIATSFVQMAYNMTDIAWLGNVGSHVVSAVGMAQYLAWLGISLMYIPKIGAEVGISQSIGQKNKKRAQAFAQNAFTIAILISIVYALGVGLLAQPIIGAFNIDDASINATAVNYLQLIAFGMPFTFANYAIAGIYNGTGNTKIPFYINAVGLILNMILDPLLIFGWGPIPAMEAKGAAFATVGSQCFVFLLTIYYLHIRQNPLQLKNYFGKIRVTFLKPILKVGGPVALQSVLFAFLAMVVARVLNEIAKGDAIPLAIQSIGAQIEALSWMTAVGFSTALGTFTGQNFGAQKWDRIQKGFFITLAIAGCIGLLSTILFFFFGDHIFNLFLQSKEMEVINLGIVYLMILSISQIFMCVEITTTGGFNGVGRAIPPAIVGITGNVLRIPFAFLFSYTLFDFLPEFSQYIPKELVVVTGVWWGISLSSILKGSVLYTWFLLLLHKHPDNPHPLPLQQYWIRFIPSRLRQQIIVKPVNK